MHCRKFSCPAQLEKCGLCKGFSCAHCAKDYLKTCLDCKMRYCLDCFEYSTYKTKCVQCDDKVRKDNGATSYYCRRMNALSKLNLDKFIIKYEQS